MRFRAQVLYISLILLSSISAILFLLKDKHLNQDNISTFYYEQYLADKAKLLPFLHQDHLVRCEQQKMQKINEPIGLLNYQFYCRFNTVFKKAKPTRKYVEFQKIEDIFNIVDTKYKFYEITTLEALPESSEAEPKIVIAKNAIEGNLPKDFYGIVITNYFFDVSGKHKIYGALYSSFDNAREERNITFKKEVINNLDRHYAYWSYLPHSRNILPDE